MFQKKKIEVSVLKIKNQSDFIPKVNKYEPIRLVAMNEECLLYYTLYAQVGEKYQWNERLVWNNNQLKTYLNNPKVFFFVGIYKHEIIGFVDMIQDENQAFEIKYFGLLPQFIAKGLGGYFLSSSLDKCYQLGASSIMLKTCKNDHAHALANYKARGFKEIGKEDLLEEDIQTEKREEIISQFMIGA